MKRAALALSAIFAGVVVSGCAVGVRQPATDITTNSATLNGKVLSTTGGPGSWYIEYSPIPQFDTPRTERTPTRSIDFVVNQSHSVSEPLEGLDPGRAVYYRVCAEDSENPRDPFCSRFQSFRTVGDSVVGKAVIEQLEYEFEIGSGPSGDDVSGFASFVFNVGRGAFGTPQCLLVHNNRAVIGLEWFDPINATRFNQYIVIEDGGATGQDKWTRVDISGPPTDCASVPTDLSVTPFDTSDIVVTDAEPPNS